jgi:ATP-dependent protease Clp ATPase subunit
MTGVRQQQILQEPRKALMRSVTVLLQFHLNQLWMAKESQKISVEKKKRSRMLIRGLRLIQVASL